MKRHKYRNMYFRGMEISSSQVCIHCGVERHKGSRFVPTRYVIDGKEWYSPGPCRPNLEKGEEVYKKYFLEQDKTTNK